MNEQEYDVRLLHFICNGGRGRYHEDMENSEIPLHKRVIALLRAEEAQAQAEAARLMRESTNKHALAIEARKEQQAYIKANIELFPVLTVPVEEVKNYRSCSLPEWEYDGRKFIKSIGLDGRYWNNAEKLKLLVDPRYNENCIVIVYNSGAFGAYQLEAKK